VVEEGHPFQDGRVANMLVSVGDQEKKTVWYLLLLGLAKESCLLILGGDYDNISSCFKKAM
jgi:hypothetical protein